MRVTEQIVNEPPRARKRKAPARKVLPKVFRDLGDEAIARHMQRPATPKIEVDADRFGWAFSSPYRKEHEDRWVALLFDAFATRSQAVFQTFTAQLAHLCSDDYDHDSQAWKPDEAELIACIQIVKSLAPRNEAEAAYAAQSCALHFAAMKLGHNIGRTTYPSERTVAVLAKTVRAYGNVLETLHRLRGGKTTRQKITVHHEKHVHTHQHVHLEGGAPNSGGQPHGSGEGGTDSSALIEHDGRTALPSPDKGGEVVPIRSDAGKAGLLHARRGKPGSTQGRA